MAARPARAAGQAPTSASSPGRPWPTSPGWRRPASRCSTDAGWDLDRLGLTGAPAGPRAGRRRAARHGRPRAALPRARARPRSVAADDQGRHPRSTRWPRRWRPATGPTIVVPAGRQPALRRVRPDRRGDRAGARARRLGARGRRVRPVGGRLAGAAAPRRPATRRPTRGPPTRTRRSTCPTTAASRSWPDPPALRAAHGRARQLPRPRPQRRRRPAREGARAVAPGPRRAGVGGAALARPRPASPTWSTGSPRTPGRWPTASPRSTAPRCSTTSCSPRSASAFGDDERTRAVTATAARRRHGLDVRVALARTATCCGSRSATGRPTTPTWPHPSRLSGERQSATDR